MKIEINDTLQVILISLPIFVFLALGGIDAYRKNRELGREQAQRNL